MVIYAEAQPEMVKDIIKAVYRAVENPVRRCGSSSWSADHHHLPLPVEDPTNGLTLFAPQESFDEEERKDGNDAINSLLDNAGDHFSTMKNCPTKNERSVQISIQLIRRTRLSRYRHSISLGNSDPTYSQPLLTSQSTPSEHYQNSQVKLLPSELFRGSSSS